MNIQQKNSAHHFRMQSERKQTLFNYTLNLEILSKLIWHSMHFTILSDQCMGWSNFLNFMRTVTLRLH